MQINNFLDRRFNYIQSFIKFDIIKKWLNKSINQIVEKEMALILQKILKEIT